MHYNRHILKKIKHKEDLRLQEEKWRTNFSFNQVQKKWKQTPSKMANPKILTKSLRPLKKSILGPKKQTFFIRTTIYLRIDTTQMELWL